MSAEQALKQSRQAATRKASKGRTAGRTKGRRKVQSLRMPTQLLPGQNRVKSQTSAQQAPAPQSSAGAPASGSTSEAAAREGLLDYLLGG